MRIDHDYIKTILLMILEHPESVFTYELFKELYLDENGQENYERDQKFYFHIEILNDQGLIEPLNQEDTLGILRSSNTFHVSHVDLRLTSIGHQFADALQDKTIFKKLKTEFKEQGTRAFFNFIMTTASNVLEKKIDKALNDS